MNKPIAERFIWLDTVNSVLNGAALCKWQSWGDYSCFLTAVMKTVGAAASAEITWQTSLCSWQVTSAGRGKQLQPICIAELAARTRTMGQMWERSLALVLHGVMLYQSCLFTWLSAPTKGKWKQPSNFSRSRSITRQLWVYFQGSEGGVKLQDAACEGLHGFISPPLSLQSGWTLTQAEKQTYVFSNDDTIQPLFFGSGLSCVCRSHSLGLLRFLLKIPIIDICYVLS